jgi:hypothetical protein
LQDVNAYAYVMAFMVKYLYQTGVPEWLATESYDTGALAQVGGVLYVSLQDDNLNHAVTVPAWWRRLGGGSQDIAAAGAIAASTDVARLDPTAAEFVATLPTAATTKGARIVCKNIATVANGNNATVAPNGAELIDGVNASIDLAPLEVAEFFSNGTSWDRLR